MWSSGLHSSSLCPSGERSLCSLIALGNCRITLYKLSPSVSFPSHNFASQRAKTPSPLLFKHFLFLFRPLCLLLLFLLPSPGAFSLRVRPRRRKGLTNGANGNGQQNRSRSWRRRNHVRYSEYAERATEKKDRPFSPQNCGNFPSLVFS